MVSPTTNFALEPNQSRKKRGAREVEEIDQTTNQNLDRDLFLCSQCLKVLRSLKKHRFGWRFIDLFTIKSKLVKHFYKNTEDEFPEDVRLVFTNTLRYNHPESSVYKNAEELKKFFEIRWEYVKKKLACEFSEIEVERSPEESEASSSDNLYYTEKVSLQTNPVQEQRRSDQDSKGFVLPIPLSPNRALRVATIKKLACKFSETEVERSPEESEESNSSDNLYYTEKVSLQTNPVKEQRRSDQDSKGFVLPMPLSPNRALRAATIKIRFADTIVKAKYRKQIDESGSNKADVMMRIGREKQDLERRQREEKARIEAEIRAPMLKRRYKERLAIEKVEEEAKSNIENHLVTEKEIVNLCGVLNYKLQKT